MAKARARKRGRSPASTRRAGAKAKQGGVGALLRRLREPSPLARRLVATTLIAVGLFCALILYGSIDGGGVGLALERGLGLAGGAARWLAPPLAIWLGFVQLRAAAVGPPTRRTWFALAFLYAGLMLALAAVGGQDAGAPHWSLAYLQNRGGLVGELLWAVAHALASDAGVGVLAAFLLAVGLALAGVPFEPVAAGLARAPRLAGALLAPPRRIQLDERAADLPVAEERLPTRSTIAGELPVAGDDPEPQEGVGEDWVDRELAAEAQVADLGVDQQDHQPPIEPSSATLTPAGRYRSAVTDDPSFSWRLPDPQAVLVRSAAEGGEPDRAQLKERERVGAMLEETLGHFGVQARVIGTVAGPHITRYELRLAPGTKVAKVAQLKDDLAYALAATEIRILAPIPGKQAVGVEVPNLRRRLVHLGDVFGQGPSPGSPLTVWLGKDVAGRPVSADLTRMPHLLVAGATGSGKSGAINAMLSCVLLRATPHELRMVLVDPKQVELNHYEGIPHLLTPVITNPRMAATALANLVREMESRYSTMSLARTRNLVELNAARARRGEPPLPYILCVIDELADLMMVAPADVEDSIIRLAQKARAVGIHLLLATQSPRVDVITGMIKANVPSRIAFAVSSQTDSRVILDQNGAESLLGQGDMLFSPMGSSKLQRIQGAYIDEAQIAKLTDHWRRQGEPELHEELLEERDEEKSEGEADPDFDPLLAEAATLVVEMQTASTSMLQRRLRVGYTRAGRLIDMLERRGVISGYEGSKPRQVLLSAAELPRLVEQLAPAQAAVGEEEVDKQP